MALCYAASLVWYLLELNQGHMDFQSIALPPELRYLVVFLSVNRPVWAFFWKPSAKVHLFFEYTKFICFFYVLISFCFVLMSLHWLIWCFPSVFLYVSLVPFFTCPEGFSSNLKKSTVFWPFFSAVFVRRICGGCETLVPTLPFPKNLNKSTFFVCLFFLPFALSIFTCLFRQI